MIKNMLSKLRSFFWPIERFELKKVLPMLFMFFFFNFTYFLLKDMKESIMVTAPGSGAEAIPFLKMWGILPLALIFMFVYSKLSNILSKKAMFYSIIATFMGFYAIFAFVLYPFRDALHPHELADKLQIILPKGFEGFIAIFRNWTYSLFYAFAELWGSVCISFLFWGFSNDVVSLKESKRFYSMFGIGTSVAMFCSGFTTIWFSKIRNNLPVNFDSWGLTLQSIIGIVLVGGGMIMLLYWWINKHSFKNEIIKDQNNKKVKQKSKMSFKEALMYLTKSRYLQLLAVLVIGYSVCINYGEIVWKSQLKIQFPTPNSYATFKGFFSTITSFITIIMLFIGGGVIRKFGWKKAALCTPIVLLITAIGFFGFIIFKDYLGPIISYIGVTPLFLGVLFGTLQNSMGKCFKNSFFEPTKEMAYIPLSPEEKTKGKAAVDVLVNKCAKAGGSFILQALILIFGSVFAIMPFISVIFIGVIIFWMFGVKFLNKHFLTAAKKQEVSLV